MGSQNVPRETKQIITKDFLVSNKEFVVEEIEKGLLETRPIISDTDKDSNKWLELNTKYSEIWPNISERKDPPEDHDKFKDVKDKYEKYFKENLE